MRKKTFEDYRTQPYSFSFLKNFAKSPMAAKAYMERTIEPTPQMVFGSLFHAVMSNTVKAEFIIYNELDRPEPDRTMGTAKNRAWKRQINEEAMDANLIMVNQDDHCKALQMREAVQAHEFGKKLLDWSGEVEKKYYHGDFMGKLDKWLPEQKLVIDWKTTAEIRPQWMGSDIKKYYYHAQAALYSHLMGDVDVMFVFIEKKEPFDVLPVLIEAGSELMDEGAALIQLWRDQADECFRSGKWPGISSNFENGVLTLY